MGSMEMWAAITAVATVALAIFALIAGAISFRNLEELEVQTSIAKKQSEDAQSATNSMLRAQIEGRQIQAMSELVESWHSFIVNLEELSQPSDDNFKKAMSKLVIWRMHHWDQIGLLPNTTALVNEIGVVFSANYRMHFAAPITDWSKTGLAAGVHDLLSALQSWQLAANDERGKIDENCIKSILKLKKSSLLLESEIYLVRKREKDFFKA